MTWRSPLALVRDALQGQRAREKELRSLVSNLPYEGQEKGKQPNRFFSSNSIKTTKYSPLFFIPMNLYEQFHRLANVYFVGLAILNFIPVVNAFQPEVALIPICVILSLTALKDAWEDFRRYQSDRKVNNTPCFVYSRMEKQFVERRWKDARVGDFVKVVCNEIVPADLLLLHSSDPNGVCYIETANLDGETNLKQRTVANGLCTSNFNCKVVCEKPNNNLNHFKCYLEKPNEEKVGAGIESLLLRGCTVRNTNHAVGFVVYAGHETKSMLNNNGSRYKRSKLERKLNIDVFFCVILLFTMCLIGALGHFLWLESLPGVPPYLVPDSSGHLDSPGLTSFYMFFTMIILLQILIPIALYVSIELVKIGQIFFITNDLDLYDEETDSRMQCRALNITEDLGQIEYIFSDKTGTLTENKMVFRRCSVMGTEFPHKENAESSSRRGGGRKIHPYLDFFLALTICNTVMVSMATAKRERAHVSPRSSQTNNPLETFSNLIKKASLFCQRKPKRNRTRSEDPAVGSAKMESAADTNGVQTCSLHPLSQRDRPAAASQSLHYEAQSPDEAALVHAARAYGFILLARTPDTVSVRLPSGQVLDFEVLDTLTFDCTRKRMSVLVRHPVTRECVLYTKGADYAIMELLGTPYAGNGCGNQKDVAAVTQHHLDCYAKEGLRTLCVAKKVVSEDVYRSWLVDRKRAQASMDNREQLIMETSVQLETDLTLLGATGIEDRLQESVPETTVALREAGIHVWVLTGDKPETAVNIGYACRLLEEEDLVINMSLSLTPKLTSSCSLFFSSYQNSQSGPNVSIPKSSTQVSSLPNIALVIDGNTVSMALSPDLQDRFVDLAKRCRTVLCCRVTPLQKSEVVKLIREKLKVMTLAVGDGANDVNMIQAADVGIGISGQEGMQAVMASDFAISRFKHLRKLLLVHGHWCYTRLANMIIYFFYKNVAYVNLLFWYQFFCGFTGTAMIDYWLMIFFNLFFTSVPPIMFGIFDKDVSAEVLMGVPELYRMGQGKGEYNFLSFWISILDAFYQSLVCFFIPYLAYQDSDVDMFTFGTPMNTVALFTILLHLSIEIKSWTLVHWITMLGSVGLYFIVTLAYNATCITCNPPSNPYWILQSQMADPMFYLICTISTVAALLPRYLILPASNSISPSPLLQGRLLDRRDPDTKALRIQEWRGFRGGGEQVKRYRLSPPPSPTLDTPVDYVPEFDLTGDDFSLNVITHQSTVHT
uniref:Phospholipid-transporting ATPase n=1 Tax=Nothobranchius furzeri TaxID=105023 RepID=A0A8C6LMS4_NOTFU